MNKSIDNKIKTINLRNAAAFTIVELLVVIVVIGILAAISIVSYTGVANKANVASIKSDLANSSKRIKMYYALYDKYPTMSAPDSDGSICPTSPIDTNYCLKPSAGTTFSYSLDNNPSIAYELIATRNGVAYKISEATSPVLANTPSAPAITAVTPNGATQMTINWTAPSFDGGSAITGYKIYRGTTSGTLALAYTLGNVLTYVDNTGITVGSTYYYKVMAINSNGDGGLSVELSGVPVLVAATGGAITTSGGYKYHTFTSSGTFNVTTSGIVDVFIVGGGGTAARGRNGGGGGGGGYTKTYKNDTTGYKDGGAIAVTSGQAISIVVGGSDQASGFGSYVAAAGGKGQWNVNNGPSEGGGGNGGSGGGCDGNGSGGSDGSNGIPGARPNGIGQGHTTREFGDAAGKLYSGGGGGNNSMPGGSGGGGTGGVYGSWGTQGDPNTGGGGGASLHEGTGSSDGQPGGSGIVIVRYVSN